MTARLVEGLVLGGAAREGRAVLPEPRGVVEALELVHVLASEVSLWCATSLHWKVLTQGYLEHTNPVSHTRQLKAYRKVPSVVL